MRKRILTLIYLIAISGALVSPVVACPMCKLANESKQAGEAENLRPKAYMYSILFMLSMPATILTSFSVGFYRMWKREQTPPTTDE